MDEGYGKNFRNGLHNFFNHHQVNLLVTGIFVIISIYVCFVSIFGVHIIHPLGDVMYSSFTSNNEFNEIAFSVMSLFFLTIISLCLGKLLQYLMFPPLFGALIVGIFFRNVPFFNTVFYINPYFDFILRKLALVVLLVRWGMGLDIRTLRTSPLLPAVQGLATTLAEVLAIVLAATLIFGVSVPIAIIGGFLLAAVSPAVTVPVMLEMKREEIGTQKGIPDSILAALTLDNFFCITAFSVISAILFSGDPLMTTALKSIGEVVLSIIVGGLIGWLLWRFPRSNESHTHMSRGLLLGVVSTALVIGMARVGPEFCGIIAALIASSCAAFKWQIDNEKKTAPVERAYSYIWDLIAMPLLFTLIGLKLDCTALTWPIAWTSLALIGIGALARLVSSLFFSCCSNLKFAEQLIVAFSLIPKATIQAAFGPAILMMTANTEYQQDAHLIFVASVMTIFITAPIMQFIITFAAPKFLSQSFVQTLHVYPEPTDDKPRIAELASDPSPHDTIITFKQYRNVYNNHHNCKGEYETTHY